MKSMAKTSSTDMSYGISRYINLIKGIAKHKHEKVVKTYFCVPLIWKVG